MKSTLRSFSTSVLMAMHLSALKVHRFCFFERNFGSMFRQWTMTLGSIPDISLCDQANTSRYSQRKAIRFALSCLSSVDPILQVLLGSSSKSGTSVKSSTSSPWCSAMGSLGSNSSNLRTLLIFIPVVPTTTMLELGTSSFSWLTRTPWHQPPLSSWTRQLLLFHSECGFLESHREM